MCDFTCYFCDILDIDNIVKLFVIISGVIALCTYWRNSKLKRAEWLHNLYTKFYEGDNYKQIRRIIDYGSQPEYNSLKESIQSGGSDPKYEELLVNYLNFFEFVASLWKLEQISLKELSMIFEYYIIELKDHEFIMEFIRKQGFENLNQLIAKIGDATSKSSNK